MQITIQALDSKSVAQWAKAGGGLALMAAMNQAQRQFSGVGRG
jgi:phosphoserine aminotransferase